MWSTEWWISVVVAGIAVNLLAAYLKPRLDRIGTSASRSWAARSEKRTHYRMRRIEQLQRSEHARFYTAIWELRCRIRATHFILFSFAFVGIAALTKDIIELPWLAKLIFGGFAVLGLLSLLLALQQHWEAMRIQDEMSAASDTEERGVLNKALEGDARNACASAPALAI